MDKRHRPTVSVSFEGFICGLTSVSGEKLDPWDTESTFKRLATDNENFKADLPKQLKLSRLNTDARIYDKKFRTYMQIHAVHSLSTIALYREYVPFTPFGLTEPKGPLDEPRLKGTPPDEDYWIKQARLLFGAARDFADLLGACQSAGVELDALCCGFTTYTVAWCGELNISLLSLLH